MGEKELGNEDMKKLLSTLMERLESQLDPDFFQDDNDVKKSERMFLIEDMSQNFVIDVFSFLTQDLNPTDRKFETALERDYVKMIRDSCVTRKFTKFIYLKKIIEHSLPHITYPKATNIAVKFAEEMCKILIC